MNRRGVVALLGLIVVLLTLSLVALEPRDDNKPMVNIPKRCIGITSQVTGQGFYLFRVFEDGSTEVLRADALLTRPQPAEPRWRPLIEPAGTPAPK